MITLRHVVLFLRLSRPHFLVISILLYSLGGAIARYLGRPVDAGVYLLGQGLVLFIHLMGIYLNEYYAAPPQDEPLNRTLLSGGTGTLGEDGLPRRAALYAGIAALTAAATLASRLLFFGEGSPLAWTLLVLGFLGAFFYSTPPVRLVESGYGELVASVVTAGLLPTFAFSLQTGELHRLLPMSTFPLMSIHFALMLAAGLPNYAANLRQGRKGLSERIGWSAAMRLHDAAIILAVASLVFAFLFGMPQRVALGTLIALPLGLAQVWQLYRIRRGFPPRWPTLTFSAVGLFTLTAYLELVGYLLS